MNDDWNLWFGLGMIFGATLQFIGVKLLNIIIKKRKRFDY